MGYGGDFMDLRQLRYFLAITDLKSFSKAAMALGVAQPALSQHVRRMEEELGVRLLHRSSRGVEATDAGLRLRGEAKRIVAQLKELGNTVRNEALNPVGEVRFGMPGTACEILGVPLIEAARERYPGIRIRIMESMSGFVLQWLRRDEVDLGLIFTNRGLEGLASNACLSEELCLFAGASSRAPSRPPGSAITLREALSLELVLPGPMHGLRVLIDDAGARVGASVAPIIEVDSYRQIKEIARRGFAYGILPRMAIDEEVRSGRLRHWPIARPVLRREVYLAYSKERPLLTPARAVGQLSWMVLRQLVHSGGWNARWIGDRDTPALYPVK
jgi:LysR family nitrogen assimilation transcriptional regulator